MTIVLILLMVVSTIIALALALWRVNKAMRFRQEAEIYRVKVDAAQARRRLHDLTRQAFVSMAEESERRTYASEGSRVWPGRSDGRRV